MEASSEKLQSFSQAPFQDQLRFSEVHVLAEWKIESPCEESVVGTPEANQRAFRIQRKRIVLACPRNLVGSRV